MSEENQRSPMTEFLDFLGKMIAVVMIIVYAAEIVDTYYPFLQDTGLFATIMAYVHTYAPLALVTVVGLEAVWDKSSLLKLVMLVACAAIIICQFLPGVQGTIVEYLGIAAKK